MTDLMQSLSKKQRTKSANPNKPLVIKTFFQMHKVPNVRLAERLGVHQMCISKWLNGTAKIPADRLVQLNEIVNEIKVWEENNK